MARLLNRFGRSLCSLRELVISHPVGRGGAPFNALLLIDALLGLDYRRLRFFVIEDDEGRRYPAVIESLIPAGDEPGWGRVDGQVVTPS